MLKTLGLSRTVFSRRTFTTVRAVRADKANGGFGEEARAKVGKEPVKDSAPYQNEVTKSGTNNEIAHNKDSYSSNTNPTTSNKRQGEALDSSPANADASSDPTPNHSNKTGRDPSTASKLHQSGTKGNRSGNNDASAADTSKNKFEKISKSHDDIQQVGNSRVTN